MERDELMRNIAINNMAFKLFEQCNIQASEVQDGRYNNWCTQVYGLMQDIQDKIREDNIDAPIQIGAAPNLPPKTATGATAPTPNPTPNVNPIPQSSPQAGGNVTNGGAAIPNTGGATQQQVADFFSQVLAGKTVANSDLGDLLNQLSAQAQNNQNGNQANF